jgi:DNA repair protein RecO (recombination protein O)
MEVANAIVLQAVPYLERQRIARLFSRERGFLSMITPATASRRMDGGAFRAMQIVEVEYAASTRGGLHGLRSIRPSRATNAIGLDIVKMNVALLWGEVLYPVLRDEPRNEPLHDYLRRSVEYLDAAGSDVANFNLFFLYRLCGLLGIRVDTSTFRPGYLFHPRDGRFCPPGVPSAAIVGPRAAAAIYRLCHDPLETAGEIPLNREGRGLLLDTVLSFIGYHLHVNLDTKGVRVLREVFAG